MAEARKQIGWILAAGGVLLLFFGFVWYLGVSAILGGLLLTGIVNVKR